MKASNVTTSRFLRWCFFEKGKKQRAHVLITGAVGFNKLQENRQSVGSINADHFFVCHEIKTRNFQRKCRLTENSESINRGYSGWESNDVRATVPGLD